MGVLGERGVNGLALGLYTNSLAFGLRVDFFRVDDSFSTSCPPSFPLLGVVLSASLGVPEGGG